MDMQVPHPVRQTAASAAAHATTTATAAALASARSGGGAQFLTFSAAGATYALGIAAIKEIIEFGHITAVPLMPPFIRGIINLRGAVVPVIDLAARLGFDTATPDRRTCVVVVEVPQGGEVFELGLVVDGVNEVLELDAGTLEPAPSFGATIRSDFISAMARIRNRFVIVLRAEQVLSIDEVSSLARVDAAPAAAPAHAHRVAA